MHRSIKTMVLAASAMVALFAVETFAKRVIWVGNSTSAENGGQHYAQNPMPGDIIQREAAGTTLAQARGKIANGDTFIIITHGNAGSIEVGGGNRDGFRGTGSTSPGTGRGCGTPVEIPPITETNVTIILHVCESADDPDGGGAQTSVVQSLQAITTGAGSTVTGKNGNVTFACQVAYSNPANPNPMQIDNLTTCLGAAATAAGFGGPNRINNWVASMGGAAKQAAVTAAIDACQAGAPPANDLPDVTFQYTQPQQPEYDSPLWEQWVDRAWQEKQRPHGPGGDLPLEEFVIIISCGEPCFGPSPVPTASEWGMIIMATALLLGGGFIVRRSIV